MIGFFEVGDRVLVERDEDCPEYVGRQGVVVEVHPGRVCRVGERVPREVLIVDIDGAGWPDGFDAEQLRLVERSAA